MAEILAAQVEVDELEARQHVDFAEVAHRLDHLAGGQPELGAVAARPFPAARALGRQLDAHADARAHADLPGGVGDELELGELLDHDQHLASQLRAHERGFDVLLVLVAVAHDEGVLVVEDAHHGQELGLGAGLEAVVVGSAELRDLLDHVAVLVDLDGVDATVVAFVAVLGHGAPEGLVQIHDPALQDVGEADEQRQPYPATHHLVDQLLEIDAACLWSLRVADYVAGVVDGEVPVRPVLDAVGFGGIGDVPLPRQTVRRAHGRTLKKNVGGFHKKQ